MRLRASWLIPSRVEWKAMLVGGLYGLAWRIVFDLSLMMFWAYYGPWSSWLIPWERPVYLLSLLLTDFTSFMMTLGIPGGLSFMMCGMLASLMIRWRLHRLASQRPLSAGDGWRAGAWVGAWMGIALLALLSVVPPGSTPSGARVTQFITDLSHWHIGDYLAALGTSFLFSLFFAALGAILGRILVPRWIAGAVESRTAPAGVPGSAAKPGVVGLLILCFFTMYFWEALHRLYLGIPIRVPPPAFMTTGDFGILSRRPCGPPCFQGITPGTTSIRDAYLKLLRAGKPCQVDVSGSLGEYGEAISCSSSNAQIDIEFWSSSGPDRNSESKLQVDTIRLRPPANITVEQLIAQYGAPNAIRFVTWSSHSSMWLYFDSIQTSVVLSSQNNKTYVVTPGTTIYSVEYQPAAMYEAKQLDLCDLQPWKGYGRYGPRTHDPYCPL